eukprot:TRINITY_DN61440_c0_g1_i1.p1 TRINITY_DN61440_c0_g1~~TRINITY_DN61440_c0_g1_i1.p1  ORF type:complete len:287 (+),score=65.21 TRINITY_DN61440_c0_g1_i1:78-863(+)
MAAVAADSETGYAQMGRSQSSELRKQHSSHWNVPEDQHLGEAAEANVRLGFIRKVYGILAVQMVTTVLVCWSMMANKSIRSSAVRLLSSGWVSLAYFVPLVACIFALQVFKNNYPCNFYLLATFTLLMASNVGLVCAAFYEAGLGMLIFQAFGLTAVIFVTLSVYALTSKQDFSFMGSFLGAGLMVLIFAGFLGIFWPGLVNNLVYSTCGALLFAGYIVYDTYRINKVFGPDDFIIAAIELYLDIINLFLYILQILASERN